MFPEFTFDFYAGMTDKIQNKLIPSGKDTFNYVVLEPFGVSLQIVPWNYPVSIFSGMVAQNLIVGNTIVNVLIAFLATYFTISWANKNNFSQSKALLFEIIIITILILIFGEIIPKTIAIKKSSSIASMFSKSLSYFIVVLKPITFLFSAITTFFLQLLPNKTEKIIIQ